MIDQDDRDRARTGAVSLRQSDAGGDADFTDFLMCWRFREIEHVGRNAYLLALAAWQRGLRVTFHYEMASHSWRFSHLQWAGVRGELLRISDGHRSHAFYRVMGDRTSARASATCESKPHAKAVLRKAGIRVPDGVVVEPGRAREANSFLARSPAERFLLKPLDGTLGRGVLRDLGASDVRRHLSALEQPILLEELVAGREYRVYVTGEQVVSVLRRRPASVLGDGQQSIRKLVERKAAARSIHPVYREYPLVLDASAEGFLAEHGYAPSDTPEEGQRVYLSAIPGTQYGGDFVEAEAEFPREAEGVALAAVRALELPNAGIDLIVVDAPGDDPVAGVVVLEANQNPYIDHEPLPFPDAHPGGFNCIAESVVDDYFPESRGNTRYPRASFDFGAVCSALQAGAVSTVSLPVLGLEWVHERVTLPPDQAGQEVIGRVNEARLRYGINVQLVRRESGALVVDGVAPRQRWERFADFAGLPATP